MHYVYILLSWAIYIPVVTSNLIFFFLTELSSFPSCDKMPSITVLSDDIDSQCSDSAKSNTAQAKQKPLIEEILDTSENNSSHQNESLYKIESPTENDASTSNKKILIEEIECPVSSAPPASTQLSNEKTSIIPQNSDTQGADQNNSQMGKLE